jgi:hypothetical protein
MRRSSRTIEWIEPQETIADDVLIPVPPEEAGFDRVALRVTCVVWAKGRKRTQWTAHSVMPVSVELPGAISATSSTEGDGGMPDRPEQREGDEREIGEVEREERQRQGDEEEIQRVEREENDKDDEDDD